MTGFVQFWRGQLRYTTLLCVARSNYARRSSRRAAIQSTAFIYRENTAYLDLPVSPSGGEVAIWVEVHRKHWLLLVPHDLQRLGTHGGSLRVYLALEDAPSRSKLRPGQKCWTAPQRCGRRRGGSVACGRPAVAGSTTELVHCTLCQCKRMGCHSAACVFEAPGIAVNTGHPPVNLPKPQTFEFTAARGPSLHATCRLRTGCRAGAGRVALAPWLRVSAHRRAAAASASGLGRVAVAARARGGAVRGAAGVSVRVRERT